MFGTRQCARNTTIGLIPKYIPMLRVAKRHFQKCLNLKSNNSVLILKSNSLEDFIATILLYIYSEHYLKKMSESGKSSYFAIKLEMCLKTQTGFVRSFTDSF